MNPRRSFATTQRGHGWARRLAVAAGFLVLVWSLGLLWFAYALPRSVADPETETGAIVVLTGGAGRVHQGLALLADGRARKLFVSGVYRGVDVEELLRVSRQTPQELACCIALGYRADNTRGNAVETAAWLREQKLRSLRLVTSAYHMPRSLLEFRKVMPAVKIVPHPVFPDGYKTEPRWRWPGNPGLIVREYSKYLVALAWNVFTGGAAP